MHQEQSYDARLSPSEKRESNTPSRHGRHIIKEFNIDLFVEKSMIGTDDLKTILEQSQTRYNVKSIHLNPKKQIPDLDGTAFTLEDQGENKLTAKCDAVLNILKCIEEKMTNGKTLDVIMLMPEGIVSYLIGSKGGQINKIMHDTNTHVVVNQPIHKFPLRTVKIHGNFIDYAGHSAKIYEAIKIITRKMQERGVTDEDYNKVPEPLDPNKIETKAVFAYPTMVIDYLYKSKEELELKSDVRIKVKGGDQFKIKHIKKEERLLQLSGKLKSIQQLIQSIIKKVNNHFPKEDFLVKIVMPSSFASKLIGAKGCLIRELANKSKGAQIKVLSDREDTDADSECLVQIAGTMANKQDACVLILEQIECFRNGGPVHYLSNNKILESGRFINETFAQQYKNSVQQTSDDSRHKRHHTSSSISYRNSRSRSSSKQRRKRRQSPVRQSKYRQERRSYSDSYSRGRKQSQSKMLSTTIIVPKKVIDSMERSKKLKELGNQHRIQYQIQDNRHTLDSTVRIDGALNDCTAVIEQILKEQIKILRK